jgi:membrane-bound lytic murein transglycosylase B
MATDSRAEAMQHIIEGFQKKPPTVQEIATANEVFRDPAEFVAEDVDANPQYEPDAQGIEADFEPAPVDDPIEKLKVDGEEREVPQSKVLEEGRRAMQKELAADKRLEEAALLKKQYEELLARANQQFSLLRRLPNRMT